MKTSEILPVKLRSIKQPTSWAEYIVFNQVPDKDSLSPVGHDCLKANPYRGDGITTAVTIYRTRDEMTGTVFVEIESMFIDGSILFEVAGATPYGMVSYKMKATKAEFPSENQDVKFMMN